MKCDHCKDTGFVEYIPGLSSPCIHCRACSHDCPSLKEANVNQASHYVITVECRKGCGKTKTYTNLGY